MAVPAQERDAITGVHAQIFQCAGETRGTIRELGVCKTVFSTDDGRLIRVLLAGVAKKSYRSKRNIHDAITTRTVRRRPPAHARSRTRTRLTPGTPLRLSDHSPFRTAAGVYG